MVVQVSDVTKMEDGSLVTEASTLGLPVGAWPRSIGIAIDGRISQLYPVRRNSDEVVYANDGVRLTVFND